jgi:hypothetical protein
LGEWGLEGSEKADKKKKKIVSESIHLVTIGVKVLVLLGV